MIAILDPWQADAGGWGRPCPRCGSTSCRRETDESIPDPKGRESRTPTDFPLHNSLF
jgi:hypothetical protein